MKVLILGAAGRTGLQLVSQALAAGHEVYAFVRSAQHLTPHVGLKIIIGDAENADQIKGAAAGCEAVLCALGHTSAKRSAAQTLATTALIEVLPKGTKVVSLTGYGVADPKDPAIPLLGRLMNQVIALIPGDMFNDGARHVQLLRGSKLAWTVIRAPRLTSGPSSSYQLGYFPLSATDAVDRTAVAAAMIDCLTSETWTRQAPMIRAARITAK